MQVVQIQKPAHFQPTFPTPIFQVGEKVISTKPDRCRGIVVGSHLTIQNTWRYAVRWFEDAVLDFSGFFSESDLTSAPEHPLPFEEVSPLGTKVVSRFDDTQGGIVVELRYDEKEACWMHRVLWANNSQSWEDYVQTYEEPWNDGEPDTTVIFPRYMVTAGKFGPYFTTNK